MASFTAFHRAHVCGAADDEYFLHPRISKKDLKPLKRRCVRLTDEFKNSAKGGKAERSLLLLNFKSLSTSWHHKQKKNYVL